MSSSLKQIDINNAFLNGILNGEVYMYQPLGFVHQTYSDYVCKLHNSLNNFKQAPHSCIMHYTHSWPTMATSNTLIPKLASLSFDASLYRNIIAFLHYLAITLSGVPSTFNKLSQHMQVHTANNMQTIRKQDKMNRNELY